MGEGNTSLLSRNTENGAEHGNFPPSLLLFINPFFLLFQSDPVSRDQAFVNLKQTLLDLPDEGITELLRCVPKYIEEIIPALLEAGDDVKGAFLAGHFFATPILRPQPWPYGPDYGCGHRLFSFHSNFIVKAGRTPPLLPT